MRVFNLPNWEALEKVVASKRRWALQNTVRQLLFRGQRCSDWRLETTLERELPSIHTCEGYYHEMLTRKAKIDPNFGKCWNLPPVCPKPASDEYKEYLVYLRHYGHPSPLLDWSLSEDVAAFFAFQKPSAVNYNVAIFLYVGFPFGAKFFHPDEFTIISPKCDVIGVSRHVNQQSKYTVCMNEENGSLSSHEEYFQKNERRQDLLFKYVIPETERDNVLQKLNSKGITAHRLLDE